MDNGQYKEREKSFLLDQDSTEVDDYIQALLLSKQLEESDEELEELLYELAKSHPDYQSLYDLNHHIADIFEGDTLTQLHEREQQYLYTYRKLLGKENMDIDQFREYIHTKFNYRIVEKGDLISQNETVSMTFHHQKLLQNDDMIYHSIGQLEIGLQLKNQNTLIIHCNSSIVVSFILELDEYYYFNSKPIHIDETGVTYQIDLPYLERKDYSYQLIVGKTS